MTAIVVVSHGGEIEIKSAFLVYTLIDQLRGSYKIYIGVPAEEYNLPELSDISRSFYKENNIGFFRFKNPVLEIKNNYSRGELVSNKIYAMMHNFSEENIVFLDSDIAALMSFETDQLVPESKDLKLKPANRANVTDWQNIYKKAGQEYPSESVITGIDKKQLPPYFNSGVIGLKNKTRQDFIEMWAYYFSWLSSINELNYPTFHRDQVALSLAVNKLGNEFELLDEKYNFPVRGKKLSGKEALPAMAHYHKPYTLYHYKVLRRLFNSFLTRNEKFKILINKYPEWERFFSGIKLRASFYSGIEKLRYKKFLIRKKVSLNR
ncbi:MAG: hypothetical protein JW894_04100 [Bacteroidales bacterium]|nr:hypothetical protein [Bacteroidales bacterium]